MCLIVSLVFVKTSYKIMKFNLHSTLRLELKNLMMLIQHFNFVKMSYKIAKSYVIEHFNYCFKSYFICSSIML